MLLYSAQITATPDSHRTFSASSPAAQETRVNGAVTLEAGRASAQGGVLLH
jgi:hypothetical protein